MSDVLQLEMAYCTLCDKYFHFKEARAAHIQMSPNHPLCGLCDKRFLNKNSLRNHYVYSSRHHYCAVCEKSFNTAAGLKMHIEYASVHRDDSDDEDIDDGDEPPDGWEDEFGRREFPDEEEEAEGGDGREDGADSEWEDYDDCDVEDEDDPHDPLAISIGSRTDFLQSSESRQGVNSSQLGSELGTHDVSRVPSQSALHMSYPCPLCLDHASTVSATRCGHVFCTPCIRRVFKSTKLCPVCRSPGKLKHLRKVYLSLV
ncbi:hypothetical protein BV22DRAFT_1024890 [Leucogyrophana mollusca]|uniref:Uncharacterized protein n=1 Tax=Leucogyrophana mollusca TaxID=85980 RepID=A0ACB8AXK2_9AGAM|nr:hypothetical protein BV22DRAFT_1024890 [Leucogyrophana mollusca]